jgi:hypothetical protein
MEAPFRVFVSIGSNRVLLAVRFHKLSDSISYNLHVLWNVGRVLKDLLFSSLLFLYLNFPMAAKL